MSYDVLDENRMSFRLLVIQTLPDDLRAETRPPPSSAGRIFFHKTYPSFSLHVGSIDLTKKQNPLATIDLGPLSNVYTLDI